MTERETLVAEIRETFADALDAIKRGEALDFNALQRRIDDLRVRWEAPNEPAKWRAARLAARLAGEVLRASVPDPREAAMLAVGIAVAAAKSAQWDEDGFVEFVRTIYRGVKRPR